MHQFKIILECQGEMTPKRVAGLGEALNRITNVLKVHHDIEVEVGYNGLDDLDPVTEPEADTGDDVSKADPCL